MADISFDEEQSLAPRTASHGSPTLVRLVMRWGFAKDEKGAEQFLLWTIGACVLLIVGIFLLSRQVLSEPLTPQDPSWPKPVVR